MTKDEIDDEVAWWPDDVHEAARHEGERIAERIDQEVFQAITE